MSKFGNIRTLERKIRSSMPYSKWVTRNKATSCLNCGSRSNLECHHIIDLYQIVYSFWKYYGEEQSTIAHVLAMHDNDECENVTLCDDCHAKRHPLRTKHEYKGGRMRTDNWTAYPRQLKAPLSHSTHNKTSSSLGLVGLQTLLALGWYVLNGHVESRIVNINRRNLAKMIGKSPGTSFNKSLDDTLKVLSKLEILNGYHRRDNNIEFHLSSDYLNELGGNPWFMPLNDVATSSMCVLTIRWFLGTQSNKRRYKIGLDKLKVHLGITVEDNWMAAQAIRKACNKIQWAEVKISKGVCEFSIIKRGAIPIHSLRSILNDSIKQAM